MKHLSLIIFFLIAQISSAQVGFYSENTDVLIYNYDESKYQVASHARIGINYQNNLQHGIFFESKLSTRFNQMSAYTLSSAIYFDRTPQLERFHFLTGAGMLYDQHISKPDYFVEMRFRIKYQPLIFEAGAAFNLKENFSTGPVPRGYIRVMYALKSFQKKFRW